VSDHPDLAPLLADPARAAEVPAKDRQAVLDALAVHEGRCRLVRELLTANLAGSPENKNGSARPQPPYALHEAAGLLLKSPAWLRRQAKAGAIPCAKKVGKSWQFPRAEFDRFCQRRHIGC
jgi:hypothetical protein